MKNIGLPGFVLSEKRQTSIAVSGVLSPTVDLGRVYTFVVIHCDNITNANGDLTLEVGIESSDVPGALYQADNTQPKVTVPASGALHFFTGCFGRYVRIRTSSATTVGSVAFDVWGADPMVLN